MENKTKIYVNSESSLIEREICHLVSSNKCFPRSIQSLTKWNWLAEVEYDNYQDLLNILETEMLRGKKVSVKRVFKSITNLKRFKGKPCKSFLLRVAMGISGLIIKPVNIKITNKRANEWQRELTQIWQKELENPDTFKKAKINNVIDIAPDGELEFCIVGGKDYIITFFNENIDEYIKPKEVRED